VPACPPPVSEGMAGGRMAGGHRVPVGWLVGCLVGCSVGWTLGQLASGSQRACCGLRRPLAGPLQRLPSLHTQEPCKLGRATHVPGPGQGKGCTSTCTRGAHTLTLTPGFTWKVHVSPSPALADSSLARAACGRGWEGGEVRHQRHGEGRLREAVAHVWRTARWRALLRPCGRGCTVSTAGLVVKKP
jgi:hypothetical protein